MEGFLFWGMGGGWNTKRAITSVSILFLLKNKISLLSQAIKSFAFSQSNEDLILISENLFFLSDQL